MSNLQLTLAVLILLAVGPACMSLGFLRHPWLGGGTALFALAVAWFGIAKCLQSQTRAFMAILDRWINGDLTKSTESELDPEELGCVANKCDAFAEKLQQRLKNQEQNLYELQYQSFQKTVMSALGHLAFVTDDFPALLDQVLMLVQQTIAVDLCAFFEKDAEGEVLVLRAGCGWKDNYLGQVTVPINRTTQVGYAFITGEPVLVEDIYNEPRFGSAPLLKDHEVISGINLSISGRTRSFGVLGAYTKTKRSFTEDEIHFLMGAAKVLAEALEQTQNQLQREKLSTFIRFNPNPVMEIAGDGSVTYFNDAANELVVSTGHKNPQEILPPTIKEIVNSCLAAEKGPVRLETKCDSRTIAWALHPVMPDKVVHAYLEDITERLSLEAQFRQAQKMESVGQLAAGIAHDFNNILTIVQGNASILLSQQGMPPKVASSCRAIDYAAGRAAGLTRQLLMLSRKSVMELKQLDLRESVGQLGKMLRRFIGENISLEICTETEIGLITADAGMVEQVIMNLAVNARDAMPRGGRLIISVDQVTVDERHVQLHAEARTGDFVRLQVSDTGCGMDANTLAHIFEPFFTTKETGKGTGLGLATAFGIVKQHGGWIEVVSEVGIGTSFLIFFEVVHSATEVKVMNTKPVELVRGGGETILLVEDEELLRDMVEGILSELGYRIIKANSGVEAFQLWETHGDSIDLLLTDMVMPGGITGKDLADEMQAVKPALKIVFMSGYTADNSVKNVVNPSGRMFLQKPYTGEALAKTVRDCLNYPLSSGEAGSESLLAIPLGGMQMNLSFA
jgi:nitrogen-specific signal transduction histidine kinase